MNILVISSILPVPIAENINDFIFHLYGTYKNLYNEDKIVIINPIRYDLNLFNFLNGNTRLQRLKGNYQLFFRDFQVEIFPFFSAWRFRNIHAMVSRSVFYLNMKRIKNLFEEYHFDIMNAEFIFADGMMAYLINKKYNIPYVISTHNEMFYFKHFYSRKMALRILNYASFVLPVNFTNQMSLRSYKLKNIVQTKYGFDKNFIRVQRKKPNDKVHILTVCGLIKLKNIDKVLEALYRIRDLYHFRYTIIGTGPEKENLVDLVNTLGLQDMVFFIDYVPHDQIADEMYKHDLFIMPSYFETFGRVFFEVMAMGIPIICAKNSGIYGLFREKEEGLAVDHSSVEEIAEAIAFLIGNREERLRIGKNGQEMVKKFTWDNIAADLHQKYSATVIKKT